MKELKSPTPSTIALMSGVKSISFPDILVDESGNLNPDKPNPLESFCDEFHFKLNDSPY